MARASTLLALTVGLTVGLAVPGTAWAGTCVAQALGEPSLTPDLATCLSGSSDGDIIELMPGEHAAHELTVSQGVTIRPHIPGSAVWLVPTAPGSASLVLSLKTSSAPYLLDDSQLLIIDAPGKAVRLEDVQLSPLNVAGVLVGRAFAVRAGELALSGVSLPDENLRYVTKAVGRDGVGGALATVESGGALLIGSGCKLAGVAGPHVDGALVHAMGSGASVTVRGGATIANIESHRGALYAAGGASIRVDSDGSGTEPTFRDLNAEHGAAIFAGKDGIVTISGGFFFDNRVPLLSSEGLGRGGHLAADQGTLTVSDGVFAGGQASVGGAIAGLGSELSVLGGVFYLDRGDFGRLDGADRNQAWRGGVVWVGQGAGVVGTLQVSDVVLERGLARYAPADESVGRGRPAGGAVYATDVPVHLSNVDLVDNVVIDGGSGGGLACQGCTLTATDLTVERGQAQFGAGVSFVDGSATLTRPTLRDNGLADETQLGGGLLALGVKLTLTDPVVTVNHARKGGGLAVFGLLDAVVRGGLVSANEAELGAGVLATVQRLTLEGTEVAHNRAEDVGGGLAVRDSIVVQGESIALTKADLVLEGAQIEGNTARDGAGVWASGVGVSVSGGAFELNLALETGGGAFVENAGLVANNALFLDNLAGVDGGGIAALSSPIEVWDSVLARNEAGQGAALLLQHPVGARVVRNRVCGNVAVDGGMITVVGDDAPSDTSRTSLSNNLIVGSPDRSSDGAGTGVVLVGAEAVLHHNNFIGWNGLAVDAQTSDLNLHHNLVLWGEQGPMIRHQDRTVQAQANLFWRAGDVDVIGVDASGEVWLERADARVQHPHLRGYLRGTRLLDATGACEWSTHHPRPASPLLSTTLGVAVVGPSPDHAGVFGGEQTPPLPWRVDEDQDQSKLIFDCDDLSNTIGDRLEQYIDADGDGLGGEVWGGDDCEQVPSTSLHGGDCDDSTVEIGKECPKSIRYYGRTCSALGEPISGVLGGLLLLGLARRRRFIR